MWQPRLTVLVETLNAVVIAGSAMFTIVPSRLAMKMASAIVRMRRPEPFTRASGVSMNVCRW